MSQSITSRPSSEGTVSERVGACVRSTEQLYNRVSQAALYGPPAAGVLAGILNRGDLSNIVIVGLLLLLVGSFIRKLVRAVVLNPMRAIRYRGAAKRLRADVDAVPQRTASYSWYLPLPGALAFTRDGFICFSEISTAFRMLRLAKHQIVEATVERETRYVTSTKEGGSVTVGGGSGGLFGGYSTGRSSKSVTTAEETAFLEIRYQQEPNGMVSTLVVPFGANRRDAEEACGMIRRMETTGALVAA